MASLSNLDRFKSDLRSLVDHSSLLELSLLVKLHGPEEVLKALKTEDKSILENLPNFNVSYEAWYSECIALLKQILPDQVQDFKDHFEVPRNRKDITYATYRIQDALKGLRITRPPYDTVIVDSKAAVPHFQQQAAILKAAERRFESALFDIRQLVQADLFDSEIGSARELLKNKFLRAAGAVAGVVLEKHLAQVCENRNLKLAKKNPGIGDPNEALKSNGAIDVPQWRFISMLGDIRNICDHNKKQEPTQDQVSDLVNGTDKVLKTIF
ncbi:hypothetical protein CA606_14100 [Caulobacter vibrioides]|uniref:DUF4145 domain-containing protein n=1 Tax=Caulobacter vibrioides TaxID=155892 RepID=A0A290N1F3_CAUVI|nr:hypothetical protein [Caulobacter vibrioides]ATC33373.1 hypothetical protein CA606_14100 [Caulobacter vibrioides]